MAAMKLTSDEGSSGPMSSLGKEKYRETLHGRKEVSFVSINIYTFHLDACSEIISTLTSSRISATFPHLGKPLWW